MTQKDAVSGAADRQKALRPYQAPRLVSYGLLKTLTMNGSMMQNELGMPMMGPMI